MNRKSSPVLILVIIVSIVSLVTWFLYPSWQERPLGLLEMLVLVIPGTVIFLEALVSLLRKPTEQSKGSKTVESAGKGSIAVGGDVKGSSLNTGDLKPPEE
jgi:hypothetical protein